MLKNKIDLSSIRDVFEDLNSSSLIVLTRFSGFDETHLKDYKFYPNYQITDNNIYEIAGNDNASFVLEQSEQNSLSNEISRNGNINKNIISINFDNTTTDLFVAQFISYLNFSTTELAKDHIDIETIIKGTDLSDSFTSFLSSDTDTINISTIRQHIDNIEKKQVSMYEKRNIETKNISYKEENETVESFDIDNQIFNGGDVIKLEEDSINQQPYVGEQEIEDKVVFDINRIDQEQQEFDPNKYKGAKKSKTESIPLTEAYPAKKMIDVVKDHSPKVSINSIGIVSGHCSPKSCSMPSALTATGRNLSKAIVGVSKRTEARLQPIESLLAALTHFFFSSANSNVINCVFYGGQHEVGKPPYTYIRCLNDDLSSDREIVTIDQCILCKRREVYIGKIYQALDDQGINIEEILTSKQFERRDLNSYLNNFSNLADTANIGEDVTIKKDSKPISADISIPIKDIGINIPDRENLNKPDTPSNFDQASHDYDAVSEIVPGIDDFYDKIIADAKKYAAGDVDSVIRFLPTFHEQLLLLCSKYKEDPYLILSIISVESAGRIECTTGSFSGLMQNTNPYIKSKLISDPGYSIEAGIQVLQNKRLALYGRNWKSDNHSQDMQSCIAYKSGQGNILAIDNYKSITSYSEFLPKFKKHLEDNYTISRVWEDCVYWTRLTERMKILKRKLPDLYNFKTEPLQDNTDWGFPMSESNVKITSDFGDVRYYFTNANGKPDVTLDREKALKYGKLNSKAHSGIDLVPISGNRNLKILAAMNGTVIAASWHKLMGYYVKIKHNDGMTSRYCHMKNTPLVQKGDQVIRGQELGIIGSTGYSTGNHLHFEVKPYQNAKSIDPKKYLRM